MNVNFYWSGNDFQFLNRLVVVSHIEVGHKVKIWVHGEHPTNNYWIDDLNDVEILNADDIFDTSILKSKADIRTTSDKWSYYLLKKTGEYVADLDAIAIKHWPDDPIVLATYDPIVINVGVIRLPKKHPVLDRCIETHEPRWGNVWIFTKCIREYGLDYNFPIESFYPVHCGNNISKTMKCRGKFLDSIKLSENCYSYHYWGNKVSKLNITEEWLNNPKLQNSLLKKLCDRFFENYEYKKT